MPMRPSWLDRNCKQRRGFRVETRRPVECPEPSEVIFEIPWNRDLRGERGQSNDWFLAGFSGRPQQPGFFFNQKNTGIVSDPFGVFYLVVSGGAEADSIWKVTSVTGRVAGRKIVVCPFFSTFFSILFFYTYPLNSVDI